VNRKKVRLKDAIPETALRLLSLISVFVIAFIFIFVFLKAWPVIRESGTGLFTKTGFDRQISEAFYAPSKTPMLNFGLLGLIAGTAAATGVSLIFASVLGIGAAITIAELVPKKLGAILTAVVRLLASIPSVIFGLVGIIVIVPFVEKAFVTAEMQIEYIKLFQITRKRDIPKA